MERGKTNDEKKAIIKEMPVSSFTPVLNKKSLDMMSEKKLMHTGKIQNRDFVSN